MRELKLSLSYSASDDIFEMSRLKKKKKTCLKLTKQWVRVASIKSQHVGVQCNSDMKLSLQKVYVNWNNHYICTLKIFKSLIFSPSTFQTASILLRYVITTAEIAYQPLRFCCRLQLCTFSCGRWWSLRPSQKKKNRRHSTVTTCVTSEILIFSPKLKCKKE